jgi:hypothetical protein
MFSSPAAAAAAAPVAVVPAAEAGGAGNAKRGLSSLEMLASAGHCGGAAAAGIENPEEQEDFEPAYVTRSADPNYRVLKKGKPCESCAVTFSGCVESDPSAVSEGTRRTALTFQDLKNIAALLESLGCVVEIIDMSTTHLGKTIHAGVLVVRGYFENEIFYELQSVLPRFVDCEMWSYGKCKKKNARWNTNVTDATAEGNIPNPNPKKRCSSQIPFDEYPAAKRARAKLTALGVKAGLDLQNLKMEVNYYFPKGFIGRHGDVERNLVIGGSVGVTDRVIQWCEYYRNTPGKTWQVVLHPGDMYIMCGKASGVDWKKSSIPTFRHCAGSQAFVDKTTAAAIKKAQKRAAAAATAAAAAAARPKKRAKKAATKKRAAPAAAAVTFSLKVRARTE